MRTTASVSVLSPGVLAVALVGALGCGAAGPQTETLVGSWQLDAAGFFTREVSVHLNSPGTFDASLTWTVAGPEPSGAGELHMRLDDVTIRCLPPLTLPCGLPEVAMAGPSSQSPLALSAAVRKGDYRLVISNHSLRTHGCPGCTIHYRLTVMHPEGEVRAE